MIDFATDDFDGAEILKGGGGAPAPGVYHCHVDSAKEYPDDGFIELNCCVLSPGTECGKTFRHRCYFVGADADKTRTCRKITLATAMRIGLTTQAAYDADRAAGRSHGIDWTAAAGRQFIGELKPREYDRADGSKGQGVNASFYAIDDERAAKRVQSWDKELLSLVVGGNSFTATQHPQQPPVNAPAQSQPQQSAPPATQRSVYDDI